MTSQQNKQTFESIAFAFNCSNAYSHESTSEGGTVQVSWIPLGRPRKNTCQSKESLSDPSPPDAPFLKIKSCTRTTSIYDACFFCTGQRRNEHVLAPRSQQLRQPFTRLPTNVQKRQPISIGPSCDVRRLTGCCTRCNVIAT